MEKTRSIQEHIENLPDPVKKTYKFLRSMARKAMPGAHEMLYHNAVCYSLSTSPWDRVCYIAHQPKGYINLGFFFGADIPDPHQLIEGKGKRIRHVKVYAIDEPDSEALAKLIDECWAKAETDIAEWRSSLRKKNKKPQPRIARQ